MQNWGRHKYYTYEVITTIVAIAFVITMFVKFLFFFFLSAVNILSNRSGIGHWLHHHFVTKKLMSPVGFILLGLIGIGVAYISAFMGYKMALVAVAAMFGLVVGVACTLHPYFGFYFCIILSALIFTPERLFGLMLPLVWWRSLPISLCWVCSHRTMLRWRSSASFETSHNHHAHHLRILCP
jgi:hypothetical protein